MPDIQNTRLLLHQLFSLSLSSQDKVLLTMNDFFFKNYDGQSINKVSFIKGGVLSLRRHSRQEVLLPENHSALKQVIRFSRVFAQHFLRFLTKHYSPAFHQDYQAIVDIYVQIMEQHIEANQYESFYFLLSVLDLHPEYDTRPLQALFGRVIRLQIGQTLHRLDLSLNTALLGDLSFQEAQDEIEPNDLQQHFLCNPNRLAQSTYHSTWQSLLS